MHNTRICTHISQVSIESRICPQNNHLLKIVSHHHHHHHHRRHHQEVTMVNKVQICPLLKTASLPIDRLNSSSSAMVRCHHHRDDKVVVIMGAAGTVKSRRSIYLATRFQEQLGIADPVHGELTPFDFRPLAGNFL